MSVCDEGWSDVSFTTYCPALDRGNFKDCLLGIGWHFSDECPHAAALRAVVENSELILVAVPKDSVAWITGLLELDVRSPNESGR